MPIPSKRFEFLDQETNIGTSDFLNAKSSSIFNSPNNSFSGIDTDLESFLTNFFQSNKTDTNNNSTDNNSILGNSRITGVLNGNLRDLSSLTTRDIDNAIAGIIPDPTLQSAFRQVSASCKNGALTPFGYGRPFDMSMSCGNNSNSYGGGCNSAQFSNLLNKLTGGQYNQQYRDINSLINNLLALSNYGLNMNMCGALNALLNSPSFNTLPYNSVNRATSVLLSSANSSRNILGALDISNVTATRNLNPIAENPNGIINMFSNYTPPLKLKDTQLSNMNDRVFGAATIFDTSWDKSSHDNIPSIVNLGTYNKDFDRTMTAKLMETSGDEDNLNNIVSNNTGLLKIAYQLAA